MRLVLIFTLLAGILRPAQDLLIYRSASAKGIALGGLYTGFGNELDILDYNIAGLHRISTYEVQASHQIYFSEISYTEINIGLPFKFGTMAAGFKYNYFPGIANNVIENGVVVNKGNIRLADFGASAAFARPLVEGLSAGARLHFYSSTIDEYTARVFSADAGLMYERRIYALPSGRLADRDEIMAREEAEIIRYENAYREKTDFIKKTAEKKASALDQEIKKLGKEISALEKAAASGLEKSMESVLAGRSREQFLRFEKTKIYSNLQAQNAKEELLFNSGRQAMLDYYSDMLEKFFDERKMEYMNKGEKLEYEREIELRRLTRESRRKIGQNIDAVIRLEYQLAQTRSALEREQMLQQQKKDSLSAAQKFYLYDTSVLPDMEAISRERKFYEEIASAADKKTKISPDNPYADMDAGDAAGKSLLFSGILDKAALLGGLRSNQETTAALVEEFSHVYFSARSNLLACSNEYSAQEKQISDLTGKKNKTAAELELQTELLKSKSELEKKILALSGETAKKREQLAEQERMAGDLSRRINELSAALGFDCPENLLQKKENNPETRKKLEKINIEIRQIETTLAAREKEKKQAEAFFASETGKIELAIHDIEEEETRLASLVNSNYIKQIASETVRQQVHESIYNNVLVEELNRLDELDLETAAKKEAVQIAIDELVSKRNTFLRRKRALGGKNAESADSGETEKITAQITGQKERIEEIDRERQKTEMELIAGTGDLLEKKLASLNVAGSNETGLFRKKSADLKQIDDAHNVKINELTNQIAGKQAEMERIRQDKNLTREEKEKKIRQNIDKISVLANDLKKENMDYNDARLLLRYNFTLNLKELRYQGNINAIFNLRMEKVQKKRVLFSKTIEDMDAGLKREAELINLEKMKIEQKKRFSEIEAVYNMRFSEIDKKLRWYAASNYPALAEYYAKIDSLDESDKIIIDEAVRESIRMKKNSYKKIIIAEYEKIAGDGRDREIVMLLAALKNITARKDREQNKSDDAFRDRVIRQNEEFLRTRANLFGSVMIKNIGNPVRYITEKSSQPLQIHTELAVKILPGLVTAAGNTFNIRDNSAVWHLGAKYNLFGVVNLRTGYRLGREETAPLSIGGGIFIPMRFQFLKIQLFLDYAFLPMNIFGLQFNSLGHQHILSTNIKIFGF
ncbi:MAG: hypothetical protein A2096_16190 [Spirochaetes bacterium GWF1_41_5]|nr:MAG: hypothetical protein A2096_16190 [Spirochaetes bacterium GWF1_41_5]HBE04379.1 hypothetical protein [Spirochaetia bacterium]